MSELHDAINAVAPYLRRYGYAAVFCALLLESFGLLLLVCAWVAAVERARTSAAADPAVR